MCGPHRQKTAPSLDLKRLLKSMCKGIGNIFSCISTGVKW